MKQRITFVRFCTEMLHLELTAPWRVLLAVTIDGVQPSRLEGEEREIALQLFGDVDDVDPALRRVLVWRLGRASGKTTIAAAICIWGAWTCDLSGVGPGQLPCAFVVSPTKPVARIAVGIARELVRSSELARFVEGTGDTGEGFILRRPDRRRVEIRSVAASRGGQNLRGRDVPVLVLDEAEFFSSNEDGGADGYSVTDGDQLDAVMPRLLELALFIGTPWPTVNRAAELYDRNHGHPVDAVVALGPSMFMRPTPQLEIDRAREMERDDENAAREYDCVAGTRGGSRLFDAQSVDAAVVDDRPLVIHAPPGSRVAAGGDLAFERDSSAIVLVARDAQGVELLEFDEVRPARGVPLAPRHVLRERFAPLMRKHGAAWLMADAHYRQSAIEHLMAEQMQLVDAPAGNQGKYDSYMHVRALLRGGQLRIPKSAKLVSQLKAVTQTPLPQRGVKITSPRRAGSGHGDIVSALVLACWAVRLDAVAAAQRASADRRFASVAGLFGPCQLTDQELLEERLETSAALADVRARTTNNPWWRWNEGRLHNDMLRRGGSDVWNPNYPADPPAGSSPPPAAMPSFASSAPPEADERSGREIRAWRDRRHGR